MKYSYFRYYCVFVFLVFPFIQSNYAKSQSIKSPQKQEITKKQNSMFSKIIPKRPTLPNGRYIGECYDNRAIGYEFNKNNKAIEFEFKCTWTLENDQGNYTPTEVTNVRIVNISLQNSIALKQMVFHIDYNIFGFTSDGEQLILFPDKEFQKELKKWKELDKKDLSDDEKNIVEKIFVDHETMGIIFANKLHENATSLNGLFQKYKTTIRYGIDKQADLYMLKNELYLHNKGGNEDYILCIFLATWLPENMLENVQKNVNKLTECLNSKLKIIILNIDDKNSLESKGYNFPPSVIINERFVSEPDIFPVSSIPAYVLFNRSGEQTGIELGFIPEEFIFSSLHKNGLEVPCTK